MKYPELTQRPFRKVLIANRGEIALRVIRACRDLGLSPLAVFSEADASSRHVSLADGAVCIGPGPSAESYLQIPKIIAAAKQMGAEAVHPGFGFLSENAAFAAAVIEAGLVWIGPSPRSIDLMGDKTVAKRLVSEAGVPCSPGKNEALADLADLTAVAQKTGYPLILKAAAGGGGRGMRVVRADAELAPAFEACQREALSYFGRADVFCERYIERPRHVEIQVLSDAKGNTVHLYERDCTIQRRHQKLVEESPSTYISEETRQKMGAVAVKAAQAVGYVNAGTVEFILESPTQFYFMEMNTRIQVEHPVTEIVTGIDLVCWQLRVAMGEALPWTQDQIRPRGCAMEIRINAEDPFQGFRPNPGEVTALEFPAGPGIRVDSHLYEGYRIPEFYDSMVAKLIVSGESREEVLRRMRRALGEIRIGGVETSIPYVQALLAHPDFLAGAYSTRFVEENEDLLKRMESPFAQLGMEELLAAAVVANEQSQGALDSSGRPLASLKPAKSSLEAAAVAPPAGPAPWQAAQRWEATRR